MLMTGESGGRRPRVSCHAAGCLCWHARRMRRPRLFALLISASLLLTGCATAEQEAAQQAQDDAATAKGIETLMGSNLTDAQVADGYNDAGDGIGVRWATETEKSSKPCPSYATSCFIIAVVSNSSCSNGIYIELALKDAAGTIVGMANEITPAMGGGDKGLFAVTAGTPAERASLAKITCM